MDIEEFRKKSLSLVEEFGSLPGRKNHDKPTAFFHLTEEVGEVGEQLRHEVHNPSKFSKSKLAGELADVILFTTLLSSYYEINLSEALQDNLDKIRKKIDKEKLGKPSSSPIDF